MTVEHSALSKVSVSLPPKLRKHPERMQDADDRKCFFLKKKMSYGYDNVMTLMNSQKLKLTGCLHKVYNPINIWSLMGIGSWGPAPPRGIIDCL